MKFNTPYEHKAERGEVNNGKYLVEIGTYQSAEKLIKSFINAGQVIAGTRAGSYDFEDGVDDGRAPDPTRRPDFDLADYTRIQQEYQMKVEAKKAEAEKAESEKVSQSDTEKKESSDFPTPPEKGE